MHFSQESQEEFLISEFRNLNKKICFHLFNTRIDSKQNEFLMQKIIKN